MKRLKLFFACLLMAVLSIGQVWAVDDVLNQTWTGKTGTTYGALDKDAPTSDAHYVGNCAGDKSSIQLRSNNSNSGIVSTVSGGKVKKVVVVWNTSTGATVSGRTLNVYGKNTAYSAATELYNSTNQGTLLGTIVCGTSTELNITGDYKYIGFRSASGAMYLTSVTITWEEINAGTISATPAKVEATAAGETDGSVAISYTDISDMTNVDDVAIYNDENHTSAFTDSWLVAGWTDATKTSISYVIDPNTGEARTAYIYLFAIDDNGNDVDKVIEVSQEAYVEPFDGLELTFPDEGTEGANVSSYTASWTATKNSHDWSIYGFNTNKWGWNAIKTGRKSNSGTAQPLTATIATQVTDHAIGDIVVTVDAVTAAQVTSHKLYVADNADYNNAIEVAGDPAAIAAGNITYTVPTANRANDLYYKLEYGTAGTASSNGILTISKITYAYAAATPQKPSAGLAFDAAQKLAKLGAAFTAPTFSTAEGFDGTVTYASSDEAVVKVNENTGAITEIVAAGKAVITAHSDETENFKEGLASYTIFVASEAGTAEDPLTEASAKAVIDLGCTLSAYVKGTVASAHTMTSAGQVTVVLAGGMQFFHMLNVGGVAFTTETLPEFTAGDVVTAVGGLFKYNNSTYELEENCQMVERIPYETPKQSIANTKETAYTVAQALEFAADPVTYDITDHVYIKGVVYQFDYYGSTSNIYIRDEEKTSADGKFEFFKCAGLKIGEADPVAFEEDGVVELDTVIGYGVMTYFSKNDIWEFPEVNYVVEHKHYIAPVVSVTGVELNKESTSLEVGETETLVATVAPATATNKAVTWASDDETVATVDENGVVTAVAEGTTTITVTTVDGSFTDDCEVTVTAADPTKHVVTFDATEDYTSEDTELSITKSNVTIAITDGNGRFNNQTDYRPWKNAEFTVSCSAGNITKIEFTCTAGNTVTGFEDVAGLDKANSVWTGNAESVSFKASNAQVRIEKLVVTYKEDNREAAGLAWDPADDIEITVGDAFSAPALVKPNDITVANITIASSNTDLATVTEGVVSLVANATGEATITATFTGDEKYKPATVSYNITVNEAGLDNVTFDSSEDHAESGETTITKGGFTLSFTSGSMDGTQAEYRLYKSQTMTLSSTDYLIKKIEFTCTSGNPITGFADATGLDKDNNEWTGESNTVELTASNAQVRMTKIKVFYVEDTRAAAGLAWNPAEDITLTVGAALSAPTLLNPNNIDAAEITIESSNTDLATVSEGVVSLVADATGTTTITATFAGNDDYKPATVSYKITVNPAYAIYVSPSLNVNFGSVNQDAEVADKKVTVTFTNVPAATLTLAGAGASAFTISPAAAMTASGDITISASSANLGTFAATLTISDDANNAESKVVYLSITVNEVVTPEDPVSTTSKWVPATEIKDGMQVLIVGERNEKIYAVGAQTSNNRTAVEGSLSEGVFTPGENTMPFIVVKQADDSYALQASNGKYLYAAGSGSGKNFLRSQDEVDDNAKWTLSVSSATANGTNTNNKLQLNNSSDIFSCYSSTQKAIALYVEQSPEPPTPSYTDIRTDLTAGNYYTVCWPKAMTAIKGATLWSFAGKDASMAYLIQEDAPFEAGKPYIIYATDSKFEAVVEGADATASNYNGLYGTLDYMDAAALEAAGATYMLKSNALHPIGTNNHLDANRAYVILGNITGGKPSNVPAHKVRSMPLHKDAPQGFENIESGDKPMKVMIEGTMYILRGEKVYDATGRLVK